MKKKLPQRNQIILISVKNMEKNLILSFLPLPIVPFSALTTTTTKKLCK